MRARPCARKYTPNMSDGVSDAFELVGRSGVVINYGLIVILMRMQAAWVSIVWPTNKFTLQTYLSIQSNEEKNQFKWNTHKMNWTKQNEGEKTFSIFV